MFFLDKINFNNFTNFNFNSTDIGIDLGTASILVYVAGKGIVLKEPSIVAYNKKTKEIKAIGEKAFEMLGRTPEEIATIRPIRNGVISNYAITEKMLKYFIEKAIGSSSFIKPRVTVCVPGDVSEVEQNAVCEATLMAGAREVVIVKEPVAAAIGVGIDIRKPCGSMIVDIGGGTCDVAVISLGDIVKKGSIKVAGDALNEDIIRFVKMKYNMNIGEITADDIKIKIGTCIPLKEDLSVKVKGRDIASGLPKIIEITSIDVADAIAGSIKLIVEEVIKVIEATPPELASDILERGIILTGGGAKIRGLAKMIELNTGIKTSLAKDAERAVAIGTGKYLEIKNQL